MNKHAYSGERVSRSLLHFFVGKMFSVLIGFSFLMLLVRAMSREEYGVYIILLSVFEILQLASSLGGYGTAYRYVPELRARNDAYGLWQMLKGLLVFRGITLAAFALVLACCGPILAHCMGVRDEGGAFSLYAIVLMFEGMARYTDVIFDSLLLQGCSQISMILRNGLRLLGLLVYTKWFPSLAPFDLKHWICIESVASGSGAIASVLLLIYLTRASSKGQEERNRVDVSRIREYSIPYYFAQLLWLAQGPDVVKLVVAKISSAVELGAFGFAAALNGMMQRYMPVFLLIGMVRPLFVSAREQGKSDEYLVGLASLIFKLNVFVLVPIFAVVLVMGGSIANLLSGGKFPESAIYLQALLVLLLFQTARTVLGLLALVVEESKASFRGTCAGMVGIMVGVTSAQIFGPLALCGGLILSEILWCTVMQAALKRKSVAFRIDYPGFAKLFLAGGAAVLSLLFIKIFLPHREGVAVILAVVDVGLVFLFVAYLVKPFQAHERDLINRAISRPLFVW